MPGRLQPDTVARVNARCAALERAAGAELAVVVVSLDGDAIENVAVKLFEAWGIGKKGADNGLLLLWAVSRRSRPWSARNRWISRARRVGPTTAERRPSWACSASWGCFPSQGGRPWGSGAGAACGAGGAPSAAPGWRGSPSRPKTRCWTSGPGGGAARQRGPRRLAVRGVRAPLHPPLPALADAIRQVAPVRPPHVRPHGGDASPIGSPRSSKPI